MKTQRTISDKQAVELFRLRYTLRRAAETGTGGPAVDEALERLLELAEGGGPSHLFFEHRRWRAQLDTAGSYAVFQAQ